MSTTKHLLLLGAVAVLWTTALAGARATFTVLEESFDALDMTPDGRFVTGIGNGQCYIWSRADGYTFIGGNFPAAISDDGTMVLGSIDIPKSTQDSAALWTATDGWTLLPIPDGCSRLSPRELSGLGTSAVGYCGGGGGFLWTEGGGSVHLDVLASNPNVATSISGDGAIIGGFAQGSFSRTPAVWSPDASGVLLDPPNGDVLGEVHGISDDGTILLGEWDGQPFLWNVDTGLDVFASPIAAFIGKAIDIADDGTIVGYDTMGLSHVAWIRPNGEPAVNLRAYLTGLGLTDLPTLDRAEGISLSGNVIAGRTSFLSGWVIDLCPNDIDGSGAVDFGDVLAILSAWDNAGGPEDLDGSGMVGFGDLLLALSEWGPCP